MERLEIDVNASHILIFGNNLEGQCGVGSSEDFLLKPISLNSNSRSNVNPVGLMNTFMNKKQSYILFKDGSVLSCGENDNNELGRSGKRSIFQRIDALEAFSITDIAVGDGFRIFVCKDGKLISWGVNSMGQLGCGDRDTRDKPKLNSNTNVEPILQLCSGSQHVLALSRSGNVYVWGGNRKGQLGNGQLTSVCNPEIIPQLRHRPVIAIACGESHSMALTIGGNIYTWGDNAMGQLGTSDTTNRLRPELLRSMRAAGGRQISAGGHHSMIISSQGLLFGFGSNSHGQCGALPENKVVTIPTVVDRFREMKVEDVQCGFAHSLVLCVNESSQSSRVYAMGLNSSGQLGIGTTSPVGTPVIVQLTEGLTPIAISSGPLSYHSFVFTKGVPIARPALPAIDLTSLSRTVEKLTRSKAVARDGTLSWDTVSLRNLREIIADAFSSLSVLNASFGVNNSKSSHTLSSLRKRKISGDVQTSMSIDLYSVRQGYNLLFSVDSDQVISTLGRATLQLVDHLRECPFDDQENLSVFLIVLENPLMLKVSSFHIAIEKVLSGIIALPKKYQSILFGWYRSYPSEYFGRILQVLQEYISFSLMNKAANINPFHAVLVMNSLYECNKEERIIPNQFFYNKTIIEYKTVKLFEEWRDFKHLSSQSQVFNYFSYSFLIDVTTKNILLQQDFQEIKRNQSLSYLNKYIYSKGFTNDNFMNAKLPLGVKVSLDTFTNTLNCYLELKVCRDELLYDVLHLLDNVFDEKFSSLKLPLKVLFVEEEAIDAGGVSKELFSLAIKQLIFESEIIKKCSNDRFVWFSSHSENILNSKFVFKMKSFGIKNRILKKLYNYFHLRNNNNTNNNIEGSLNIDHQDFFSDSNSVLISTSCLLGLLVGLASYSGVLVDLPLPSFIYKIMVGDKPQIEDLFEIDTQLANSLSFLLEFEEGVIQDELGLTFTASTNPLLDSDSNVINNKPTYIDLKPFGSELYVDRSNRKEFVDLFLKHCFYGSCDVLIKGYLFGMKILFNSRILESDICTCDEIEILLSGTNDLGDFSELRLNTTYKGEYNDEHELIQWFWDILSDMQIYEKRHFLHFVTGSDRVPVGGISKVGLIIQSVMQQSIALPTSHTCFNTLNIPISYQSKEVLKEKLYLAIKHREGFGFA